MWHRTDLLLVAALAWGCTGKQTDDTETQDTFHVGCEGCVDEDEDGWTVDDGDCDDANAAIHPHAGELCNDEDDDCDTEVDEGLADSDHDGICDGLDVEECDGLDNDGDGEVDEDFGDVDEDGVADCVDAEDCDGIDNDGDDEVDEGYDADDDGFTQCGDLDGEYVDCDDTSDAIYPGAVEVGGDLIDNDCDVLIDETAWAESDLFITEILANPGSVPDPSGEWFEVYNLSDRVLILNGLVLTDGAEDWHQIDGDEPILLHPSTFFVFGATAQRAVNGGVDIDYVYSDLVLGNEADSIAVAVVQPGEDTLVVDEVSWDGGLHFPDTEGASLALEPSFFEPEYNDDGTYWCSAPEPWDVGTDCGSPGAVNDVCTSFDHDGDGYTMDDGDCDDYDETIYPGAPEIEAGVDNDCDGVAELAPVAVAEVGEGSKLEVCRRILLDGSDSYDPDAIGDVRLSYLWSFSRVPVGSALTDDDIAKAYSYLAAFYPDVAGVYTLSLVVFDGGAAASEPALLEIEVAKRADPNKAPIADAGRDQMGEGESDCAPISYGASYECPPCDDYTFHLDGSNSMDPDEDFISYWWSVTSGSGIVDDPTSATPSLRVAGPTPEGGSSAAKSVVVALKVTDCMGDTSRVDTVAVTYECYGATATATE